MAMITEFSCWEICAIGLTKFLDRVRKDAMVPSVSTGSPPSERLDTPQMAMAPPATATIT